MSLFNTRYHELLNEYLANVCDKVNISFELFPPKDDILQENFWRVVDKLKLLNPIFFSVTCGAFLGEKNRTYDVSHAVYQRTKVETVPHLTCIDLKSEELKNIARKYWDNGMRHILALRGDVKDCNIKSYVYAIDLIKLLKSIADFNISVAAYPEVHPEAYNAYSDLVNLKKKIDAGANRAITQFFFSVDHFLRFRDICIRNGITIDIVPGIFPITNFRQLCNFSKMSNVKIPHWIHYMFRGLENDLETSKFLGASIAIDIVKVLYKEGVRNFHFYTMNKLEIVAFICHVLGKRFKTFEYA
ncbi:MAG: methylenetetrahydrofolate reductase [Buchnera aphidicola (Schlechtendalia peitan)]